MPRFSLNSLYYPPNFFDTQQDDLKKREEREKKKAEVRARLEASSVKANKKKGFMTPERKKKLRVSITR